MFILSPDPYLQPSYRISPFKTADIAFNNELSDDDKIEKYFYEEFEGKTYQYTLNGREAINMALNFYHLKKEDIVTILTTTGNFYISSCVTNEIEKFCKWSRKVESGTKVILVNHEFGFPYERLGELSKMDIPIIEDCAHSFFSKGIAEVGDFAIYSFPKMFPLQIGGLLVCKNTKSISVSNQIDDLKVRYIKNILSYYVKFKEEIIRKRISNYNKLNILINSLGFTERFQLKQGDVPGVFMFQTNEQIIDLPELKKYFYSHGVQSSVFYGEESFFLPVHQGLNEHDMLYFYQIIKSFLHNTGL